MSRKTVFVTVGTTKFDELINTITQNEILKALNEKGYNHLILQIGNTSLDPDCTPRCGFKSIVSFHLNPSLEKYVSSADLIISHAGAGSCLEALEAKKPLIVVTNELLMDNHQLELAQQLHNDGHLYYCTCDTLLNLLQTMDLTKLKPFTSDKSRAIANLIDQIMGFD
ncbi:UDP-N-acetylglucosamine transferase subunit ALG13 homolog [Belonocnema kinseyi]|uniref:UDP-N-acetylglucosamine transferase subunit ALG13 homolog n=1 Tax=Belonocnema kinseyi TaxID=2817044 RepID=UPI00143D052A|nr:UDP-N-acetylglucosamine transferase subunit ALG13 homolog [Belonocnema kinseyi]